MDKIVAVCGAWLFVAAREVRKKPLKYTAYLDCLEVWLELSALLRPVLDHSKNSSLNYLTEYLSNIS